MRRLGISLVGLAMLLAGCGAAQQQAAQPSATARGAPQGSSSGSGRLPSRVCSIPGRQGARQVGRWPTGQRGNRPTGKSAGLVCPHAGYEFSGSVAAAGYKQLMGRDVRTVIIMGPSHYARFRGRRTAGC